MNHKNVGVMAGTKTIFEMHCISYAYVKQINN